ncbi:MAG: phosphotransferase [Clostridium sp.]
MGEKEVLKYWGFDDKVSIEKMNIDYETERKEHIWTINRKYILKMSKNKEETINNIYMSKLLNRVNISTQEVIETIEGESYSVIEDKYYTLFKKIEGTVLKNYFEGDFIKRGNSIGKALGNLHDGLYKITDEVKEKIAVFDNDLIAELKGWVIEEIDKYLEKSMLDKKEVNAFKKCINQLLDEFSIIYFKLPRQIIHRDFHGENIIFKDDDSIGFIDFDLSQINARLFDICYLCTGSLATIFDNFEMRGKWIEFATAVIKGYESVNKLTVDEIKAIKYMMISIEMIMIAYFAREGYYDIVNINIKMVNYLDSKIVKNQKTGEIELRLK